MERPNDISATSMIDADVSLDGMWSRSIQEISDIEPANENWKNQTLPLARIKKIMKSEEITLLELERERLQQAGQLTEGEKPQTKFMISGEAPVLMTKACELLIRELSVRAWQHTERNRRRTLQRADLHAAVGESEVFDFLIDIVPRVTAARAPMPTPQMEMPAISTFPPHVPVADPNILSPGHPDPNFGNLSEQLQNNQFSMFLQHMQNPVDNTDAAQPPQQLPQWNDGSG